MHNSAIRNKTDGQGRAPYELPFRRRLGVIGMRFQTYIKKVSHSLVLWGFFVAFEGRAVCDQPLELKKALDLVESSSQAISSFDVRISCSIRFLLKAEVSQIVSPGKKDYKLTRVRKLLPNETPQIVRKEYRQVFQGGRGRIEFLDQAGEKASEVVVYNPEKVWSANVRNGTLFVQEVPDSIIADEGWDYLRAFRNIHGQLAIIECLRKRRNVVVKELEDNTLIVLETMPEPKRSGKVEYPMFGFRVTLDKRRGCSPSAVERLMEIAGQIRTIRKTKVVEWHDLGGGLWVPIKVVTNQFNPEAESEFLGEPVNETVLVVDVGKSSWNRDLPAALFTFPIPSGTKVTDRTSQVQYVTGKPDPGTNLDDLAANARRVTSYPVIKAPRVQPRSPWPWILGGGGAIVSALAVWLSLRFIRHRRAGHVK